MTDHEKRAREIVEAWDDGDQAWISNDWVKGWKPSLIEVIAATLNEAVKAENDRIVRVGPRIDKLLLDVAGALEHATTSDHKLAILANYGDIALGILGAIRARGETK